MFPLHVFDLDCGDFKWTKVKKTTTQCSLTFSAPQVLGGLPVRHHQPEPLAGGPLGSGLQRFVERNKLHCDFFSPAMWIMRRFSCLCCLPCRLHAGVPAPGGSHQPGGGVAQSGQRLLRPAAALPDQKHERARAAQLARRELLQEVPLPLQETCVHSDAQRTTSRQDMSPDGLSCHCLPAGQTCVDIKDNVVNEGYYFTPKGDDPCLSCTCHDGEPEMCVAALCERPQGCQHFRKDPKECCKFTCLDPGNGRWMRA